MRQTLILVVLFVVLCVNIVNGTFRHPGILVGAAQLAFIKTQVANQVAPIYTGYTKAIASDIGSKTYVAKGPQYSNIACGSYSDPDNGCSDDDSDSSAAYLQALLWYITGDTTYANNAINLMNAYANKVTTITLSNAPLQAGWSASKWPRAAEIIRYTSTLWSDTAFNKFVNWLNTVHLPLIKSGSSSNGNWELAMIEGTINIAVLSDDQDLFDSAVTMWRQRVPAYFYISTDGSKPVPAPRGTASWYGQTVWNSNVNGICQETCRDLGHTQFGLESTLNIAATAITQGTDLFTEQQTRLVAAMEFNARWVNGETPPSYLCGGNGVDASTKYPGWELGYNHYHNKEGVSMPNTLQFITNYVRKQSELTDKHITVWETLTNSQSPA